MYVEFFIKLWSILVFPKKSQNLQKMTFFEPLTQGSKNGIFRRFWARLWSGQTVENVPFFIAPCPTRDEKRGSIFSVFWTFYIIFIFIFWIDVLFYIIFIFILCFFIVFIIVLIKKSCFFCFLGFPEKALFYHILYKVRQAIFGSPRIHRITNKILLPSCGAFVSFQAFRTSHLRLSSDSDNTNKLSCHPVAPSYLFRRAGQAISGSPRIRIIPTNYPAILWRLRSLSVMRRSGQAISGSPRIRIIQTNYPAILWRLRSLSVIRRSGQAISGSPRIRIIQTNYPDILWRLRIFRRRTQAISASPRIRPMLKQALGLPFLRRLRIVQCSCH
jgi:hypothetical protein